MPTGPFASLGVWPIFEHDGLALRTGATPRLTIVKATRKFVKYTRKCARYDPKGERIHHAKVYRWDARTFRVSVGNFQHIEAVIPPYL